jgi:hypothetical protein
MDRAAAENRAARLQAEHPDRDNHRFLARQKSDGSWSVTKLRVPAALRNAPMKTTPQHAAPREFADDRRSGHEIRVPGLPGGLG